MSFFAENLPFHIEFIHGIRLKAIRDYAISSQLVVNDILYTEQNDAPKILKKFHIAFTANFLQHLIESQFDASEKDIPKLATDFEYPNAVWFHHIFNENKVILSSLFKFNLQASGNVTLNAENVTVFGNAHKQPVDALFTHIDEILHYINRNNIIDNCFEFNPTHAEIHFNPVQTFLKILGCPDIQHEPGHTDIFIRNGLLNILYDNKTNITVSSPHHTERNILTTKFSDDLDNSSSDSIKENIESLGNVSSLDEPLQLQDAPFQLFDEDQQNTKIPSVELPAIDIDEEISISEEMSIFESIRGERKASNEHPIDCFFSDDRASISTNSSIVNDACDNTLTDFLQKPAYKIVESVPDTPTIKAIHRAIDVGESLSPEAVHLAIDEAKEKLLPVLQIPFLYLIHLWSPELDEELRFEALCQCSHNNSPTLLPLAILKAIYLKEQNGAMLITLLQRQLSTSSSFPHKRIQIEIEYAEQLTHMMKTPNLAIRKLDELKPYILKFAHPDEHIRFAQAYHHAQYSGIAIQHLKQCMKQAETPDEIALYGYQLAKIMFEHNEPIQSIITVCSKVLEANPHHYQTLEHLAKCLEATNRFTDAADAWQLCFDQLILQWELAQAKTLVSPTDENNSWLQQCRSKAIQAANILENVLDSIEQPQMRCLVLKHHMRLEPNSTSVLSKLLKTLELMHAYHEMANECLTFLNNNKAEITPSDEISIRLTLHNIYDSELARPDDAVKQLNIARDIAALDPRVISTELERCRKRGMKTEQIGLRIALIEALPPQDSVPQTLELVQLYESLQYDIAPILDILRKTNARAPNNPQILMELRFYLRKLGQNFELATVLEKLARVTKDLQTRKNILMEASEVHEKLGNHQISQSLYHEAQLCSPINPNSKAEFMPQNLRAQMPEFGNSGPDKHDITSTSSIVLTSRSLSVVEDISAIISSAEIESPVENSSNEDNENEQNKEPLGDGVKDSTPSSNESVFDESASIEDQIVEARIRGNTQALLDRLIQSIENIPLEEQPPRILQEIGCIYLYDRHDPQTARRYLEKASELSHEVASGEQTLNALEIIYQSMKQYRELSEIYQKKCEILTISDERKKYEIRLAQIRYDQLGETELAIETLNQVLENAPGNETALQLLAQIYIDTQNQDKAIDTLLRVSALLKPNSKKMAQHQLRLISIYSKSNQNDEARKLMRELLDNNDFVDKLVIIELYKTSCRENDEWEELCSILQEELAIYLHIPPNEFELKTQIKSQNAVANAPHTLREYADVLYQKLNKIDEPVLIYQALAKAHPEDKYPVNILYDIAEQHPDNPIVKEALSAI